MSVMVTMSSGMSTVSVPEKHPSAQKRPHGERPEPCTTFVAAASEGTDKQGVPAHPPAVVSTYLPTCLPAYLQGVSAWLGSGEPTWRRTPCADEDALDTSVFALESGLLRLALTKSVRALGRTAEEGGVALEKGVLALETGSFAANSRCNSRRNQVRVRVRVRVRGNSRRNPDRSRAVQR